MRTWLAVFLILIAFFVGFMIGKIPAGDPEAKSHATVVIADAYLTADAGDLLECRGELMQYIALGNKLFYEAAGGPKQVYWQEPYLYLPNDARTCNASLDPIACAKAQPGTFTFRLETIFDGTLALVPTVKVPPPPPVPGLSTTTASSVP